MPPKNETQVDQVDETPAADAPAEETTEALAVGDVVELHDGCYALVVAADPVSVVRLGHPQAYELPARKVG